MNLKPHLGFGTPDDYVKISPMLLSLLIGLSAISTELPFAIEELIITSPSNIIVHEVDILYVEDVLVKIPGLSIREGKVYFFDSDVLVTKDGIPVEIEDVVPQFIERVEFVGEPSATFGGHPVLNFISKTHHGDLPESRVWVRTGDTLGFDLKRDLQTRTDINLFGRISDSPLYEASVGCCPGEWKLRAYFSQKPSLMVSNELLKIRLSDEYQRLDTHFETDYVNIGVGTVIDSNISVHALAKVSLSPLLYIVPQLEYDNDSIIPKLSAGWIPYYGAIIFVWYTPSQYGGGVRFKGTSIFFNSPDYLGVYLQSGFKEKIDMGLSYDNQSDRLRIFLGLKYPFKNNKIIPQFYIRDNLFEFAFRLIDVKVSARIKKRSSPIYNISWRFKD